jgi:hypothetical protein
MRSYFLSIAVLLVLLPAVASANRGLVSFNSMARIYEPNQWGIIAWNGSEQILILKTDIRASIPTKVLQMFPSRHEPSVKAAPRDVYGRVDAFLNPREPPRMRRGLGGPPARAGGPAGVITGRQMIGSHDLTITRVLDPAGFVAWVQDFLRARGVESPTLPPRLQESVSDYIAKGFQWFVFDVVEVGVALTPTEPIMYRFKTDHLFYPLVITQTEDRAQSVELLVFTPGYLREFPELPRRQVRIAGEDRRRVTTREVMPDGTIRLGPDRDDAEALERAFNRNARWVDAETLHGLNPDLADLMRGVPECALARWKLIPATNGRYFWDLVAR